MAKIYKIKTIRFRGERVDLAKPIRCEIIEEGRMFIMRYKPLSICVFGEGREGAIEAFNEEFLFLVRAYGLEDDENLTEDARKLKRKIKDIIKGDIQLEDSPRVKRDKGFVRGDLVLLVKDKTGEFGIVESKNSAEGGDRPSYEVLLIQELFYSGADRITYTKYEDELMKAEEIMKKVCYGDKELVVNIREMNLPG